MGVIEFRCPACSKQVYAPDEWSGRTAVCPGCRMRVEVPESGPVPQEVAETVPAGGAAGEFSGEEDVGGPMSRPLEKVDPEELIDMTAMVDIVFFLLIFFLVTSFAGVYSSTPMPVPEQEGTGADLAQTLDEMEADEDWVTVRIDREDAVEVEGTPLSEPADLGFRLNEMRRTGRGTEGVLVVADGEATHGTAVAVLDAARDAGLERLRLSVAAEEAE